MAAGAASTQVAGFKRHLHAEVSDSNGVFFFSEHGVTTLHGSGIGSLAALLDGTRDIETLLHAGPAGMETGQVASLIAQLVDAGLVTVRPAEENESDERSGAYWDACGINSGSATRDGVTRVGLRAVGDVTDGGPVEEALRAAGLDVGIDAPDRGAGTTDLTVVTCDDYLNPELSEVDRAHRRSGQPWLLAKPVGAHVWVGPVFQPGVSGCWHCLAVRLWRNRHAEACAQATLGNHGPAPRPPASTPSLTAAASHLVALEATKWLAGHRYSGQQCVWTLDTRELHGQFHELRARPQCPECGDALLVATRARTPVTLRTVHKTSYSGGGHRSLTPDQVLDRYRHLVSPVTGVVKEIKRDPRGPALFNSFRAGPNLGAKTTGMDTLHLRLRDESGGKGVTAVDAEAGALCEALERYSGSFHGDEERIRASLSSLGDPAIHPNECMLFHERQYATRSVWNAAHSPFQHVCEPFDERAVLDWTPVWSLTRRRQRLLPTGMLYYGAPGQGGQRADSNGNAAGSSREDAVLQGLLELVERDAVALWWYNRTTMPGVALDAFPDPWIDELRRLYAELGREIWALDVTSDLGVPTMAAVSRRIGSPSEEIMFGFGAHLDPHIALRRALTELNQLMPAIVDAGTDSGVTIDDPDATHWWRHATVGNQPYLMPDAGQASRAPESFGYTPRQDLAEDVAAITATLSAKGLETLVLDQTRPDIELPVVKVIVPGMRHFWARFGPGRLYDVPVELGRLNEPTAYEDLNPMPLFL